MQEQCPPGLDSEGQLLWQQCRWIIEGGTPTDRPDAALQMQALWICRELRQEARANTSVAAEREACARIADDLPRNASGDGMDDSAAQQIAWRIRDRSTESAAANTSVAVERARCLAHARKWMHAHQDVEHEAAQLAAAIDSGEPA